MCSRWRSNDGTSEIKNENIVPNFISARNGCFQKRSWVMENEKRFGIDCTLTSVLFRGGGGLYLAASTNIYCFPIQRQHLLKWKSIRQHSTTLRRLHTCFSIHFCLVCGRRSSSSVSAQGKCDENSRVILISYGGLITTTKMPVALTAQDAASTQRLIQTNCVLRSIRLVLELSYFRATVCVCVRVRTSRRKNRK